MGLRGTSAASGADGSGGAPFARSVIDCLTGHRGRSRVSAGGRSDDATGNRSALTASGAILGPPAVLLWQAEPLGRDAAAEIGEADGANGGFARYEFFPASRRICVRLATSLANSTL
jgi:hypothetical protein